MRFPLPRLFACLSLFAVSGAIAASATEAPTKILAIRQLGAGEASREFPVTIRGVVTYHEPAWFLSFVQDETAGIYVSCWNAPIHPGDLVEAEGVTAAGRVGRIVVTKKGGNHVRVLGKAALPESKPVRLDQLQDASFDAQWISVEGTVDSVALDGDRASLVLSSGELRLRAVIPGYAREDLPSHLVGFKVQARGVLGTLPTPVTSGVATVLYIPSIREIAIDPAAFNRRFESFPISEFESLFSFARLEHREPSRIQGRVTFAREGRGFFVNLYAAGHVHGTVYVQSTQPGSLSLGDLVDAVGNVGKANGKQVLQDAVFRVLSHGDPPGALHVPSEAIRNGDFHGHLIWAQGKVVENFSGLAESAWLIRTGFGLVSVRLARNGPELREPIEEGSTVGVTGILLRQSALPVGLGDSGVDESYQMQMRSAADLTVIAGPPWWTVRRIAIALGLAAAVAATALLWVFSLRRRVREQMATIRCQLEREAVAEERTRIARDLHDTLAQHLAGITIQLDAVAERLGRGSGEADLLLETAREMAAHSMDQARLAIWDLRSPTLARDGLFAAFQEALQPLAEQRGIELELELNGDPRRLGARVENHILRIVQEAAANAFKHAKPTLVRIVITFGEEELSVMVSDDGQGFDVPPLDSLPAGHFGLRGILERVKKLNARLLLDSKPGAGTTVTLLLGSGKQVASGRAPLVQLIEATAG